MYIYIYIYTYIHTHTIYIYIHTQHVSDWLLPTRTGKSTARTEDGTD